MPVTWARDHSDRLGAALRRVPLSPASRLTSICPNRPLRRSRRRSCAADNFSGCWHLRRWWARRLVCVLVLPGAHSRDPGRGVQGSSPDLGLRDHPGLVATPCALPRRRGGCVCGLAAARSRRPHPCPGPESCSTQPVELPGVVLAAVAGIGLGIVLGPEAPLIALGGGLGFFAIGRLRGDAPPELATLVATCGTFAAVSFLFGSPLIAAVLLIEAAGLGGTRLPLVLIPGLLAAGIGTLVSIGLGSWTGVDSSDISLGTLPVAEFARPDIVDFLWTVPLAAAIAIGTVAIFRLGRTTERFVDPRPFSSRYWGGSGGSRDRLLRDHGQGGPSGSVLRPGRPRALVANADELVAHRSGAADRVQGPCLCAFARQLPRRPGISGNVSRRRGRADGSAASRLRADSGGGRGPGRSGGRRARLPLSAVVLATVLTSHAGLGAGPLVIVGVVVAYLVANLIDPRPTKTRRTTERPPRNRDLTDADAHDRRLALTRRRFPV